MRILLIGDVIGRPGRRVVRELVPALRRAHAIDLIIANGENAAGGIGLTEETAQELLASGVDVITSGNHVWDRREVIPALNGELPILRPLNYPEGVPGRGYLVCGGVLVVNLIGRVFIGSFDCPFRAMDRLLDSVVDRPPVTIVDFHAEATSEKIALGWYLDGRVSAVLGTHTHVGTIDARVLPQGTAFVSDVGMTGPIDSVIGDEVGAVISRFLSQLPHRLSAAKGRAMLNSVLVEVEKGTGKARSITRIDKELEGNGS